MNTASAIICGLLIQAIIVVVAVAMAKVAYDIYDIVWIIRQHKLESSKIKGIIPVAKVIKRKCHIEKRNS